MRLLGKLWDSLVYLVLLVGGGEHAGALLLDDLHQPEGAGGGL